MKKWKKYSLLLGIIGFITLLNLIFFLWSPELVVSKIGVENTYLIAFLVAAIGGLSTLTGAALFTTIATFVAGGSDPLLLAMVTGTGIFISDSIFFLLISYGRESVPKKWDEKLDQIKLWMDKRHPKVVLPLAYLYMGFTPLPNDLLMIALVIGGYTYKQIVWIVLAGSLTVASVTVYLGHLVLN